MPDGRQVTRVAAPLRMQVVELLREAIVGGEFEPGERLVEARLCQRFDVSRTVIRETIRQLESEGLVTIIPNRGPVVTELTSADAVALYEVRAALEGLAGSRFAVRATDDERSRLRAALDEVARAFARGDLQVSLAAKDTFYEVLLDGARNPIIRSTLRGIHARVQLLRGLSLQAPDRSDESLGELSAIVEATDRRDADAARTACERHVARAAEVAIAMLEETRRHDVVHGREVAARPAVARG